MRFANGIAPHTLPKPEALIPCDVVLDIGAGIRPMQFYRPKRHICIDPYAPYVDVLQKAGYEAHQMLALEALHAFEADAIYLLDVIEHMEKDEGREVIDLAVRKARCQVAIYTPWGFVPQNEDTWGYGGHEWQTHRSGWLPEDFPGWTIEPYNKREGFTAIHG